MATYEYVLPELGEGIESGDVIQILVAVGETIAKDQSILELETDKAVIEVPAPVGGVVQTIHVQAGDKAAVGQLILTVETAGADGAAPTPGASAARMVAPEPATPTVTPHEEPPSSGIAARNGGQEHAAEPAAPTPPSRTAGERLAPAPVEPQRSEGEPVAPAAPSVRRLAREIGVDINTVAGSGPSGRISVEDVKGHARQLLTAKSGGGIAPPLAVDLPDFTTWGMVDRQAMSGIRRKTAEHMAQAWATIPHVTQFAKADITELEQLRQRYAPQAEAAGGKLTITAIVLKTVVAALQRFPQFNASVDMTRQEVVYKQYYHIGVAVDTERGLLVPVIRDVDRKGILALSVELSQVAERARSRKVTLEELQGGTFTVTNLGGIGGTYFSPIINAPEVAILGLARSSIEPVYCNSQFEPRLMLPLALSYDHRLIDGADGARFLRWVAEALQEPFLIALGG
jgi:pyruvate dehydrogenase E2 component (dihydrolipoamide acetyltransferase)